jgi:hypothetical protein
MPTDANRCLLSHSKFACGIQEVILSGNITSITAPWSDMLKFNVDLWEIVTIEGKGRGIVATASISKGTIIAMYGGVIFDQKKEIPEALGHSLDRKDSGKTLAINGCHWFNLPKFAQAALANEPNVNALPKAHIT